MWTDLNNNKFHHYITATFRVKEDFFMYKSGIYRYSNMVTDSMPDDMEQNYHSVRVVGLVHCFT